MLRDLIISLSTPLSHHLRALAYLDEALALRRRHRRTGTAWLPHLDRTRQFVLSSAAKCRSRNKVVVLGSGLLLDVPLEELSGIFREVVLKDVVCLPEARKQIKRSGNARFVEHDVTSLAEQLYRNHRQGIHQLPDPASAAAGHDDADLVISLNILSQLWVIPRAFAATRLQGLSADVIDDWCGRIVEAHYTWLRSLACDVCLVADHAYVKKDAEGSIISRGSSVYGLRLPAPDAEWTWNIVPQGRDSPHGSKELHVGGWLFPAA